MTQMSVEGAKQLSDLPFTGPETAQSFFSRSNHTTSRTTKTQEHDEYFNQATILLHESCESGDTRTVERVLSSGKADLNALIGGHRAYRTALHKASAYGHTNVVKLLLKAGANADRTSNVQRTALHEACMGGHKATVMELVQYVTDLNLVDNYGQTAAHIAAYHGETECLNVLIDSGCDFNCGDKQTCTPAHLAAMKSHPETLRCLLDNDVDILKPDAQGRTSVHYAALYGSTACLKVFKEYHVNLKITDHFGGSPLHLASAGGHIQCLKFLIKSGLSMDIKDRSGKTAAHYAAQKGSIECLHWILEQGLDANIMDDSGNTPAHCAASGHMEAMNCLFLHNCNMLLTNNKGDTPEKVSRKYGHSMAYQKVVNGAIKCPFCVEKQEELEYNIQHQPSEVEKNIKSEEQIIFKPPVKMKCAMKPKTKQKDPAKPALGHLSKRNLSSKYYGDHLFSLTSDQGTHHIHKE